MDDAKKMDIVHGSQRYSDEDCSPGCSSIQHKRPASPDASCVSLKTDCSMNPPPEIKKEGVPSAFSSIQQVKSDLPDSSCVSMKTDCSMNPPPEIKQGSIPTGFSSIQQDRSDLPDSSCVSMKTDCSMNPPPEIKKAGNPFTLSPGKPETWDLPFIPSDFSAQIEESDTTAQIRRSETQWSRRKLVPMWISFNILIYGALDIFKAILRHRFQWLREGTAKQRNPTFLNEIYTELYITESGTGEINNEHEVRQIEIASRKIATEGTPINCNDIFEPLTGQSFRTVLTTGVAGIGKTVSVQKFILDWAERKANQDVHFIFPLPFRELNLLKNRNLSFLEMLHIFFTETQNMEVFSDKYKILFIFDGLDECRLSLDFKNNVRLCDVTESASVDVLLTNLIRGNLIPSALIWITSRPAAANLIPSEYVNRWTEIRGFKDPQKEEYIMKRVSDQILARKIITHLKSSRSLYIMCHIPVFCWISTTVLERMFSETLSGKIPKTLTQMYTHFLIIQTNIKNEKDYEKKLIGEDIILQLCKLAFQQLQNDNLIFYDDDLKECGIDVTNASVCSGLCTEIFREELGLCQRKVYCFVHLSIQEHLAALYVHLSFVNNFINVIPKITKPTQGVEKEPDSLCDLHQRAIELALTRKNGSFDIFLRFLLGMSVEIELLFSLGLLKRIIPYYKEKTISYIKAKVKENPSPEKYINLFHCLNELGDHSLMEEVQNYLRYGALRNAELSPSRWSAIVFVLLTSEQEMEVFQLNKYVGPQLKVEDSLLKMLPMVRASVLSAHNYSSSSVSEMEWDQLLLNELSEQKNKSDEILQNLLPVVKECKSAELKDCSVTYKGCAVLASVLKLNPSHLKVLELNANNIGDSGVKLLSAGLESPHCILEVLRMECCDITDEGCAALASALSSNTSHLRELDLSENKLGDSGMKLLSAGLESPHCVLEKLWVKRCGVTDEGCAALASALRSSPSHLKELDLTWNKLRDAGVKLLSAGLDSCHCELEILKLNDCDVTDEGCAAMASALRSNPSHLRELYMSVNKIGDTGVKLLSIVLGNPDSKLEIFRLRYSGVTDEGCAAVASALISNPSHLRELCLCGNKLGDTGVKLLSAVLENSQCKLEKLWLMDSGVTDEGCATLASALRLNPSHLKDLNLSGNKLGVSAVKLLTDLKDDPDHSLMILLV